jgi:hypothetical protein
MAGSKRRSPTSTLVSKGSIEKAGNALTDLPEKPKEIWSLREAIDALKDEITVALDRGYTYPEISQMLTHRGVEISASTLKYYLSAVKRQDPNSKPRRRRRTLGASLSAESLNFPLSAEAPKRGRGRAKAVVTEEAPVAPKKTGRGPGRAKATVVAVEPAPVVKTRAPRGSKMAAVAAAKAARLAAKAAKAAAAEAKPAKVAKVARVPKAAKAVAVAKPPKVARIPKAPKAVVTPTATKGTGRGRKSSKLI